MSELREKIEEAWWKIDARGTRGQEMMPTPKEHLNLLGDKQQYLDAALEAVKAHIGECPVIDEPPKPHDIISAALNWGAKAQKNRILESLE